MKRVRISVAMVFVCVVVVDVVEPISLSLKKMFHSDCESEQRSDQNGMK